MEHTKLIEALVFFLSGEHELTIDCMRGNEPGYTIERLVGVMDTINAVAMALDDIGYLNGVDERIEFFSQCIRLPGDDCSPRLADHAPATC